MPRLSATQRLLGLLLLLALLLAMGFAVSHRLAERLNPEPAQAAPPPAVQVRTVESGPLVERRAYRGSVEAETHTTLAARTTAKVLAIPHREGTYVERGQLLIQLDDEEPRQELERLRAVATRLSGELSLARREQTRHEDLYQRQHTPEHLLDEARQRVRTLEAQVRENQAMIALARTRLSYTVEQAPFDGVISRVSVHEGELVPLGRGMIELLATDKMKAVLSVPQRDAPRLALGQRVELEIEALGWRWEGTVDRLYPTLDPTARNTAIAVLMPASARGVKPGMMVHGSVELAAHAQAVQIPVHAMYSEGEDSWVFLYEAGVARQRKVEIGQIGGGQVHVVHGLSDGERLITTADPRLVDGMKLRVRANELQVERP